MKVYVQDKSFKMVGKAKEIRAMLSEYRQYFETVNELIEKNHHTYTVITSTNHKPIRTRYYFLIPQKKIIR